MDCPVCKYPNPPDATHCGLCQEVFNRSAAQTYMHAVRRERMLHENSGNESEAVILSQHPVRDLKSKVMAIDWQKQVPHLRSLLKRATPYFVLGAGLVVFWIVASHLFSGSFWYFLIGKRLAYSFSEKTPTQYLVGMKSDVKSWSERQGHLDTPLEHYTNDEIGNVLMQKRKVAVKKPARTFAVVSAKEWIQISHDTDEPVSRAISQKHSSLAEAHILLDKKGNVLERRFALSPRLSKSVPFLVPRFPTSRLRRGKQWTETVHWLDDFSGWLIAWTGTLHWTAGDLEPCRENTCAKLTYTADLEPRLAGAPDWARGAVRDVQAAVTAGGEAFFDASHERPVSNSFAYNGTVRIPIRDLGRIPLELRIGNLVRGRGDIVIRFENKIDIQKS